MPDLKHMASGAKLIHKDIGKPDIGTWREVENQPIGHTGALLGGYINAK